MSSEAQPTRARSTSRTRTSRPTTPLRPSSRSSFRESARAGTSVQRGNIPESFPLNTFEPAFAELSDAMADLEANMMHFQLMHESLSRFSESFASFLYGLNMNAFCVDFPEGPIAESFKRAKMAEEQGKQDEALSKPANDNDGETTFMTTDTSFVDNPTTSSKPTPMSKVPEPRTSRVPAPSGRRGASGQGTGRGPQTISGTQRGRPSGLARPRGRGLR